MDKSFKHFWNSIYERYYGSIKFDKYSWLSAWLKELNQSNSILELGCGYGNNAKFLENIGLTELATDFSDVALDIVRKNCPTIQTQHLNLMKHFPFKDDSFDIVIADLCLHYFSEKKTEDILAEIQRVLKNNGLLLARVNSTKDFNHGAGQGQKLEENFFYVDGYNKRFFNEESVQRFFGKIGECDYKPTTIERNKKNKEIFEIVVQIKKE
ncbi:hypothetical protein M9Y10_029507 [Tritrichomonas musculus]|uniref:Methyltransferase type 11 domain-containing protein n=1 Tax=Tritrichomonas musculus TaxID=1915356 RepID=A0ABR2KMC5_9EUKA